jgi:hypothetical protein
MTPPTKATPGEFGQGLKRIRESAGLSLEAISARTKIGCRMLAAIEDGAFDRLPNQVFARMFVRQYLEFVGAPRDQWLPEFDAAWRHFAESSQPFPIGPTLPVRRRRLGPWIIGLALVAGGVTGVLIVERRPNTGSPAAVPATALVNPPEPVPAPPASAPPVQSAPTPPPTTLVLKALQGPCWVEVRIAGEEASSRLLAAGTAWEVPAGGKGIDLVLGDAGAASVTYMGDVRSPAGRPGEVAHIHLAGTAPAPGGR